MASVLVRPSDFPPGTSVGAYPQSRWPQGDLPPTGAPKGAAVVVGIVDAAAGVTLSGLTTGVPYYLAGQVSGTWRYRSAFVGAPSSTLVANEHGADTNAARLSGGRNLWIGSVEPANALPGDLRAITS